MTLSGCASGICTGWGPIKVSQKDQMTSGTERQILSHNEYGSRLGCTAFKPRGSRGLF